MGIVKLIPGKSITGEANDRHDPNAILNVKEFYEQDSHVMPEELKEMHVTLKDKIDHVWYEYAPADLVKEENPPLIISFHGGGQDGYSQCYATSWVLLADKYRFVTMFPTGSSDKKMWNPDPNGPDFPFIHEIIRQARERYGIDEERIFLQGMSMGNMMTTGLCKAESHIYAGAGMAAGPDSTEFISNPNFNYSGITPIPVFQSRGERDGLIPKTVDCKIKNRYDLNKADREFWLRINGCSLEPDIIKIDGRNNYFLYKGKHANLIYRDVKMCGHGQTIDDAELVWRYCFSGCRRKADGSLVITETLDKIESDEAVILADGCKKAYVSSEKRELCAPVYEVREHAEVPEELYKMDPSLVAQNFGPYMYVPVTFLAEAFGFTMKETYEGHGAVLSSEKYSLTVEVSEGNVACLYNEVLSNMERQAEYKDGILFIPIKDFVEKIGKTLIVCDGVFYITDHAGEMTNDFARYIKMCLA